MPPTTASARPWTPARSACAAASLLVAVAPVLLMGIEWTLAWWSLGHPPRPSLDDPSSIGGLSGAVGWFTGLSLVLLPVAAIGGPLAWLVLRRVDQAGVTMACSMFHLAIGSICVLRSDPLDIVTWWFD